MKLDFEGYLLSVIADPGRPGLLATLLRGFLAGCAGLYDLGLEAYLAGEALGLRRRDKLPIPVISIGNLTVGGTGKTPMTQMLCRRLLGQGKRLAVLSRGHGGDSQSVRLVSEGSGPLLLSSSEAGDEPTLLAQTLPGVPVLVGKDRRQSGREALRRFGLEALILDDGFQFWQLARDLDIVLLDGCRPFDNGYPLPRGLLREPKRHLKRARIVVVTRAGRLSVADREVLTNQIVDLAPQASVYFADHQTVAFVPTADLSAEGLPLNFLENQPVFAICAIAQPQSFMDSLERDAGVQLTGQQSWSDHHSFSAEQIQAVMLAARQSGAEAIVMTEKDAVKWHFGEAGDLPTYALRIEMAVENESKFLQEVCEAMKRRK